MSENTENKKGRATPKRKESEARLKVNSIAPSTTKEGKARDRSLEKSRRIEARAAYMRGDENALPARDRGPVKRYVRNYIDSRRTIGEYFLPTIMVVLVLTAIPVKAIQLLAILFMYAAMLYSFVSAFFVTRKIKKLVAEKFPNESLKGLGMYGWLRSTQMRRMRAPAPQVKRGDTF
jgi:Protein of unknown function (DUF3043)